MLILLYPLNLTNIESLIRIITAVVVILNNNDNNNKIILLVGGKCRWDGEKRVGMTLESNILKCHVTSISYDKKM